MPPTAAFPVAGATRASGSGVMVYVPAGEFAMGRDGVYAEEPKHNVTLAAFWIDRTEVTNAQYAKCVLQRACLSPAVTGSSSRRTYFGDRQFDAYPVVSVTWFDAEKFCRWDGKRLPTEAEWEKAARGTDGRLYPWGNDFDASRVNSKESGAGDTTAVGAYPGGASPYGALDMGGNVWEWVQDWYDANYYPAAPPLNPTGPAAGNSRVVRGGGWISDSRYVTAVNRGSEVPSRTYLTYGGFRWALGG